MIKFDNPESLRIYLESNDHSNIKFRKIRIRKDSGFLSISTDSEELCISFEMNSNRNPLFSAQDIVDLITSLDRPQLSTSC